MRVRNSAAEKQSAISFPPAAPALKLPRGARANASAPVRDDMLAEERRRLAEDVAAMREREANLRDYEARLRRWQEDLDASRPSGAPSHGGPNHYLRPSSRAPFENDAALQAAWEKLHRARELFEVERSHLVNDRLAVRADSDALRQREAALNAREARLNDRERQLAERPVQPPPAEPSSSAVQRFTQAPFAAAKAVFRKRK